MTQRKRMRVLAGLVGLAVVIALGAIVAHRSLQPIEREIDGTIAEIDLESRTAALEFTHPKTGQTMTIRGEVPADCDIRIDGRPATLRDLRIGERISVHGQISMGRRVTALAVRVSRGEQPGPSSGPAPPATAPGQ